jgi:hypothetical protein
LKYPVLLTRIIPILSFGSDGIWLARSAWWFCRKISFEFHPKIKKREYLCTSFGLLLRSILPFLNYLSSSIQFSCSVVLSLQQNLIRCFLFMRHDWCVFTWDLRALQNSLGPGYPSIAITFGPGWLNFQWLSLLQYCHVLIWKRVQA